MRIYLLHNGSIQFKFKLFNYTRFHNRLQTLITRVTSWNTKEKLI
jgi:hypothetical protein